MSLGEKIIALRKSRGMSQEQLAGKISVSRQAVSKWELNESVPDIENVVALSRLFGVTTDYLIINEAQSAGGAGALPGAPDAVREDKTMTVLGCVLSGVGAFGAMVLMILSSLIETTVPIKGRTGDGGYWYSATRGYAFFPFVKERNLGFLLFILLAMLLAGVVMLIAKKVKKKGSKQAEDKQ